MIGKTSTLKLIKSKVDAKKSGKIKLKKPVWGLFSDGVIKTTKRRRVTTLVKNGNSILWMDDAYELRNINILDSVTLHKIMWQLISDKEKKDIALEHLVSTKSYLED